MDYEGTCYIAVIGSDLEYVECRDSIMQLQTRPGDQMRFIRATKGYEARQMALNEFKASSHGFILFLDQDQVFPPDTLERLRSHKLPYVSGYYMRRRFNPILPVWYEYPEVNGLPFTNFVREPERGQLHKLGASGWGCMLVHRAVIEALQPILKGEPEILEDDMDVWPYDLAAVVKGEESIKPLRGKKDVVGSDLRFPFFAREVGFTLYGDPDVRCGHITHYPLSPDDYSATVTPEIRADIQAMIDEQQGNERRAIAEALEGLQ
jgi:hypothetical protein